MRPGIETDCARNVVKHSTYNIEIISQLSSRCYAWPEVSENNI